MHTAEWLYDHSVHRSDYCLVASEQPDWNRSYLIDELLPSFLATETILNYCHLYSLEIDLT